MLQSQGSDICWLKPCLSRAYNRLFLQYGQKSCLYVIGRVHQKVEKKCHLPPHKQNPFHFSSVAQSCLTLCHPVDCSTLDFPVHHQLPDPTQTHVHRIGDAIQPSHPLSSPSPPIFNLSQHRGLFKWVCSSHQEAKVLEFQHQSFQWIFRTDFL